MNAIAIGIDGSTAGLELARQAIARANLWREPPTLHLVNVQYPFHGDVSTFINRDQVRQYHQDCGMAALREATQLVAAAGLPYEQHVFVGDPAETLGRFAREQECTEILVSTRGKSLLGGLMLGSVAFKLLQVAETPVLVIRGR